MTDLTMVLTTPPADDTGFGAWLSVRAEARLSVPGVRSATCYRSDTAEPPYLTTHELDDVAVLESAEWQALDRARPDGERDIASSAPASVDRRVYRGGAEFHNDRWDPARAHVALGVWMSVDDPDDFARWYSEEHVPLLFAAPGWLRVRRFELVSGSGPAHLALHDLESLDVNDDPRVAPARNTPWRDRVVGYRTAYERRIYERLGQ